MPPFSISSQPPVTLEVVRKLQFQDDASALAELAQAATCDDQFLRRMAVEIIGRHPRGRELSATVLKALIDPSEYVVRTACDVAARWDLKEAHEFVLPLLTASSIATRRTAISTLGTLWLDRDFPRVFVIYKTTSDIDIRRDAALVLRKRVNVDTWQILFDAFRTDPLPRHRRWACEFSEKFSGPDILPALSQLSSDVDGHVRSAATRAIQIVLDRK